MNSLLSRVPVRGTIPNVGALVRGGIIDGKTGGVRGENMKEKIKMPISFHGNFVVAVTEGDEEKRGRCQKLFIKALPVDTSAKADGGESALKYRITYFDFGCRYLVDGILVENEEDHVSFAAAGKVYRFSPALVPNG